MAKTSAEKANDAANRQRELGRTQRKKWAHPDDWEKINKFIIDVNEERLKKAGKGD